MGPQSAIRLTGAVVIAYTCALSNVSPVGAQANSDGTITPAVVMKSNYTDGSPFILKMCSAADTMDSYSTKYQMSVFRHQPTVTQGGSLAFKKNRLMRVEVTSGKNNGALAVLQSDGKVHGHPGGALKVFRGSISPDSPKAKAPNGIRMVDGDFYSLASFLRNMLKKGDHSRLSSAPIQTSKTNSPTFVLDVFSGHQNHEHLIKRVYADPSTYLPVYWEDYHHGKLSSESSWSDVKTNVSFPSNYFTL